MKKSEVLESIHNHKVIAVVRADSPEEAFDIAEAAYKGGIKIIEMTMTTPNALTIITKLKERYGSEMVVGAGTVIDEVTARLAIDSGADFIVSPHLQEDIVKMCHLYQTLVIPGAANTREIVEALKLDCYIIKLFPANLLGPKAIKSFKGPFPQADFIPTGGVNVETISDWITSGAIAAGTGSELTKAAIETSDMNRVTEYAIKLIAEINKLKYGVSE